MTEQVQKQRSSRPKAKTEDTTPVKQKAKSGDELKAELDALLDDIEEVLEENAEQFVADFIQGGGE